MKDQLQVEFSPLEVLGLGIQLLHLRLQYQFQSLGLGTKRLIFGIVKIEQGETREDRIGNEEKRKRGG